MGATDLLLLLLTHPLEFRTLTQYWLYYEQKRDITSASEFETSGYDRETMKRCWELLDKTSRSFSSVIKELDGDLARVVSGEELNCTNSLTVPVVERSAYFISCCVAWTQSRTT